MVEKYTPEGLERLIQIKSSLHTIQGFLDMDTSQRLRERKYQMISNHAIELLRNLPKSVYAIEINQDITVERDLEEKPKKPVIWNLLQVEAYAISLEEEISS
jgi:hypothetical protein